MSVIRYNVPAVRDQHSDLEQELRFRHAQRAVATEMATDASDEYNQGRAARLRGNANFANPHAIAGRSPKQGEPGARAFVDWDKGWKDADKEASTKGRDADPFTMGADATPGSSKQLEQYKADLARMKLDLRNGTGDTRADDLKEDIRELEARIRDFNVAKGY